MKIGVNARLLHSEILEGVGRYKWETISRIVLKYPEHQFFFFFDRAYPDSYIVGNNITPIILTPPARHPFLFYLWFEVAVTKAAKTYDIDLFYSADSFMSLSLKVPTVLVVHDLAYLHYPEHIPFLARLYYRYFIPKFIKKADRIVCVSEFVKSDIINSFSIDSQKISIGYNALPSRLEMVASDFECESPYFIYVGSINPRKNLYHALLAFKMFISKGGNYKFIVIGRKSSLDNETEKLLTNLISEGSVIHLSNVSDTELLSIFKDALALVYISLFEGFGIPILEAMSLGVPVITSNVSSMPEIAGDAAMIVDPLNLGEIVAAMETLSCNNKIRDLLIEKGYQRVQDFSWDETSDLIWQKMLEVFEA